MRNFIFKIALYFTPIIIMAILVEIGLRSIPNEFKFKNKYVTQKGTTIKTLILGNSHSYYGIKPEYLEQNCFNASQISQPLQYDYLFLKHFENYLSSVQRIILNLSSFSLFFNFESADESWRNKNYILYYGINNWNSYKDNSEILSLPFSVNYRRIKKYWQLGPILTCSEKGWGNNYTAATSKDIFTTAKKAAKKHNIRKQGFFDSNKKHLQSIIDWCNKRKVQLLLYTPPSHKAYYQRIDTLQLNLSKAYLQQIVQKYQHCRYLDLLKSDAFVNEDFYDADHLNDRGAKKLSILLSKYLAENLE